MRTQTVFLLLTWAVLFALAVDAGFTLLNQKNTYINVAGVFFLAGVLTVSFKTKCLTKNPFNK